MKKAIGIPFMFLATILILAHAFIPHQHHNRIVITISELSFIDKIFKHSHNHLHSHGDDYSHTPLNHDNKVESGNDCFLDDLFRQLKQTRKCHLIDINDNASLKKNVRASFFITAAVLNIEIRDYAGLPLWQNPNVPASLLLIIYQAICFRGPPDS